MTNRDSGPSTPANQAHTTGEAGQSIVLIALVFAALVAFLGLATDVGLAFVRSSQHSKSVDAATLAGVVDLTATINGECSGVACSDLRAQQFLSVNGWPTDTLSLFRSAVGVTSQGYPEYTITVTWPVDTFFLRILGIRSFDITHAASAAYYAQSDILAPSNLDGGQIRKASQFAVGDVGCSISGDPVLPRFRENATVVNTEQAIFEKRYRYRIRIPAEYRDRQSIVVVELFDTDTANLQDSNEVVFSRSQVAGGGTGAETCLTNAGGQCVVVTGEELDATFQNPLWFHRVDEMFDLDCSALNTTVDYETVTHFHMFYINASGEPQDLAIYTDDNSYTQYTDLKWVTPCDSGCNVVAEQGSFEVDLNSVNIPVLNEFQEMFLDVTTTSGASRNVWDIFARPPFDDLPPLPANVNDRNLWLVEQPYNYYTQGIDVFAQGRMPLEHFIDQEFTLQLTPLPIEVGQGTVYASIYGYDPEGWNWTSGQDVVDFQIDTLPTSIFAETGTVVDATPDPDLKQATCDNSTNCAVSWLRPQYQLGIDSNNYAGGTLLAIYNPGADAMTWSVAVTAGRPFLTR